MIDNTEKYKAIFKSFGEAHEFYLDYSLPRFLETRRLIGDIPSASNLLDIGAHWLHQTLMYALEGHLVMGADLPFTIRNEVVRKIADAYEISLYEYSSLADPRALDTLESDSFDIILFTEIIEHMTFNPIAMWRGIHRIVKPGGRIVLTTPNFYFWKNAAKSTLRFSTGGGAGIKVETIVHSKDTAPHWKEYSRRELIDYFRHLSPDFEVRSCRYMHVPTPVQRPMDHISNMIGQLFPIFRRHLFCEIHMGQKATGIVIEPRW